MAFSTPPPADLLDDPSDETRSTTPWTFKRSRTPRGLCGTVCPRDVQSKSAWRRVWKRMAPLRNRLPAPTADSGRRHRGERQLARVVTKPAMDEGSGAQRTSAIERGAAPSTPRRRCRRSRQPAPGDRDGDALCDWPACGRWSFDFFKQRYGSDVVSLSDARFSSRCRGMPLGYSLDFSRPAEPSPDTIGIRGRRLYPGIGVLYQHRSSSRHRDPRSGSATGNGRRWSS